MAADPHLVGEILDALEELAEDHDEISVEVVVSHFGSRSYGPVLVVPSMLEISPLGAIPGVPTFLAVTVAIVALQMLFDRKHVWLPAFIADRCVSSGKLAGAADRMRGVASFLDLHFHGRLKWLTRSPFSRIAALVIVALCIAVPPLELLPFAAMAPMFAVLAFGLALLVRDGLLMLAALALGIGAFALGIDLWHGGLVDSG